MYKNDAAGQNTRYVNDMLVRAFKFMLIAVAAMVILKVSGIIVLPWLYLIAAAGAGTAVCVLPIACRHFRMEGGKLKYVNVYCAAILCTFGYCYLNMGIIILLAVPIGLACLYFDAKLIGHASVLSAFGLLLGEALSGGANWRFATGIQESYIRIAMYILQLGIATALLRAVSKRAENMLSQTYSFYENINDIFSSTQVSSQGLEAAEDILLQGVSSLGGNNEKDEEDAPSSNAAVRTIISNINKSMENAREIMKYTHAMLKGKDKDLKTGDEVIRIEEYTRNSKELISKLARYTDKINEDLSLIAVMVDESKLLSMNAAAEAENASSGSKGSAIIAMKVEKLADESAESAYHIQEILNNIVSDAENTVKSVAETYEEVFKSLELINRSVETLIKWLMYKNMK